MVTLEVVGWRRAATVLALLVALLCAQSAQASPVLVIEGAGNGHGVGMSQVGAEGLALHGYTATQILSHYYTGTSLERLRGGRSVTVLLQSGLRSVVFRGASRAGARHLNPGSLYIARNEPGGEIALENAHGRPLARLAAPLHVTGASPLTLDGAALSGVIDGRYRGSLELTESGRRLDVINRVGLESYLKGVVPAESPASWPAAELEAQAIAARSYAITSQPQQGFDLYGDTRSQQYGGYNAETPATDAAVSATSGEVVAYAGVPVTTFYFASSGGETESVQDAFAGAAPEPYLTAVLDPFDTTRFGPTTMTLRAAQHKLRGIVAASAHGRGRRQPRHARGQRRSACGGARAPEHLGLLQRDLGRRTPGEQLGRRLRAADTPSARAGQRRRRRDRAAGAERAHRSDWAQRPDGGHRRRRGSDRPWQPGRSVGSQRPDRRRRTRTGRMSGELLAVDTPWLLYRSHFALPSSIRGKGGARVGALLGTVNTILGLVQWGSPRAVACCMGAEEADYRVALYRAYHAHRDPMPDELRAQWEQAPELLAALGWTVTANDALEADDLMWSYSRVEARAGGRTLICSGDRDLFQAVDEHTQVLELRRDGPPGTIDAAEVQLRSGVEPARIPDLIALRGDPSDGLPGAKGIGAKTAAALLAEHGTLEGVLAAADAQRPRIAAALRDQEQELRAFHHIATLQDIDVARPPDGATDHVRGAQAARELGMNQLAKRLEQAAEES
jgi:5'-3' exonuclease